MARGLGADVITTDADPEVIEKLGFGDVRIVRLGPLAEAEPLRQIQATFRFSSCDFRGRYDFFILSGNWAHYAAKRHHPNLYYNHGHARFFYDLKEAAISSLGSPPARLAARLWIAAHGRLDRRSIAHVDRAVANSEFTASRFRRYLGRDSSVVYPPVDTARFRDAGDGGYWLSVNRLFPEKRVELQLEAFARMPGERLVIVGGAAPGDYSGSYARAILAGLPPNVTIVSGLSEDELAGYYGRCRGLVATARGEPFGMAAVEAMASGKPVVAVREGGYLETVADGETGRLVDADAGAIARAVGEVSREGGWGERCVVRARRFGVGPFLEGMRALVGAPV